MLVAISCCESCTTVLEIQPHSVYEHTSTAGHARCGVCCVLPGITLRSDCVFSMGCSCVLLGFILCSAFRKTRGGYLVWALSPTLSCTALHCTTLHFIAVLHCNALHCTTLKYTTRLHTLRCTAPHCNALQYYTALRCQCYRCLSLRTPVKPSPWTRSNSRLKTKSCRQAGWAWACACS